MSDLVPVERIQSRILVLRGVRVLVDADLASLYGVPTKRLNEQVKRNAHKFPDDFVFRLTWEEVEKVSQSRSQSTPMEQNANHRSQNATLKRGQNVKFLPYAFTEYGAIQAANVLNSEAATTMGIAVVRAFIQLRQMLVNHRALATKLAELDARVGAHDEQLAAIIEAIRQLTTPPGPDHDRKIGFQRGNR